MIFGGIEETKEVIDFVGGVVVLVLLEEEEEEEDAALLEEAEMLLMEAPLVVRLKYVRMLMM